MNKTVVFLLYLGLSINAHSGGVAVGNGGDLVRCAPSSENDLFGFYALDYLVHRDSGPSPREITSWEGSLYKIRRAISEKVPELLPSFQEFTLEVFNKDKEKKHIWESVPFGLRPIADEELPIAMDIPENCETDGKVNLVQAVIRQFGEFSGSDKIIFKYMNRVFDKLAVDQPLQLSFILVHEWLWSHSQNVDRNRRINWFLHSEYFDDVDRFTALREFNDMGLKILSLPVVVDQGGLGHYRSLSNAIEEAPIDATILIREGQYFAPGIPITKSLNIFGDGDADKIIISGIDDVSPFEIAADDVVIKNLTLTYHQYEGNLAFFSRSAVQVKRGNVILDGVIIDSDEFIITFWQGGRALILGSVVKSQYDPFLSVSRLLIKDSWLCARYFGHPVKLVNTKKVLAVDKPENGERICNDSPKLNELPFKGSYE